MSMKQRNIALVMGIYFLICLLAITWPFLKLANHIYPLILGMPFLMFWFVLWNFIIVIGLVLLYRLEYNGEEEE